MTISADKEKALETWSFVKPHVIILSSWIQVSLELLIIPDKFDKLCNLGYISPNCIACEAWW